MKFWKGVVNIKIYIAGAYSAPTWEGKQNNTDKAIEVGVQLILKGHNPLIPHLTHYIDKMAINKGINITWEKWMKIDDEWLCLCDALLLISNSRGANIELERAKQLNKIIYYSLEEIPKV
jgi:hypothetical protein